MNWITNFVRPKIRALVGKPDQPENLWIKCPSCAAMIFHRDLARDLNVCGQCGHHMRLSAPDRLAMLMDGGDYTVVEAPRTIADPLRFRDQKRYSDRLKDAQAKMRDRGHGADDAVVVAHGSIGGSPVVVAVFEFGFMGGSMGVAVGEAILTAARLAVVQQAALIAIPASGGARMQEGILSLMQMPRTTIAVQEVQEAGLPYIVLLTDPTTGGVSASFAMLGDIAIAEPGAMIGFAGQRVIEETIRETLPEGFQRAEYLLEHGMVDIVAHRGDLRDRLANVLDLLRNRLPSSVVKLPVPEEIDAELVVDDDPATGSTVDAEARAVGRAPTPGGDG